MTPCSHTFSQPWPFADPVDLGVITTVRVLLEDHPVLLASHDEDDGGWQFLCGTTDDPGDGRIICFGCIFDRDPSIGSLADLPRGWSAWRDSTDAPWQRAPNPPEPDDE